MQYLSLVTRCLIGAVFLASAVSKGMGRGRFRGFVAALADLRLLPAGLTRPVALLVIILESAVCLLVAAPTPPLVVAGHLLASGLVAGFAVGIAVALRRGSLAPCPCFGGSSREPLGIRQIWRNLSLLAAGLAGAAATSTPGPYHLGGGLVAAASGLVLGAVVVRLDDIVGLFRSTPVPASPARSRRF